jgi:asparagine synthase (glutamine-hydrolysing)
VTWEGVTVRLARSLDRPMRYFLAKRQEGPALYVADRIDTLHKALATDGLADQFHPSYTRMVPAHYLVEVALVGCPDPDPIYRRFFTPKTNSLPPTLDAIGERYVGAMAAEVEKWLTQIESRSSAVSPIGVAFSGGIDSGAVFLVVYHTMLRLGLSPSRLKAFVLNLGDGPDVGQARRFLAALGLSLFLEEIEAAPEGLDVTETLQVIEDYKPLDLQCAAMGLALCRGIRARYPDWRHLADGDGGDENLKDYPIEENPELTIRSVINNLMLYQEGWGVGRIKHSLTYSGGLSRSYVRTYAPARRYGFTGFSPYAQPSVIEVAEGIPFAALTQYDVPTLYGLKGEILARGVKAVTGLDMPVFPKRRFQHGAMPAGAMRQRLEGSEQAYRRAFHALYA